jgi:hypothetical protein
MALPETFALGSQSWEWFSTLTFDSRDASGNLQRVPRWDRQKVMLFSFLRESAHGIKRDSTGRLIEKVAWDKLVWCARGEAGEKGGRDHFHVLIAGFPFSRLNPAERFALESIWRGLGGGHSQFRLFDPSLGGVKYVLKGLSDWSRSSANAYEFGKFGKVDEGKLILSNSFLRKWGRVHAKTGGTKGTRHNILSASQSARGNAGTSIRTNESHAAPSFFYDRHPAGLSFVR